ncbi:MULTISPECIES: CysB family HTH-type transcriptional regulator [Modicisalibacter]|uniref:CysB family HTH-type transcriptional regulator n=1 Tax=Modicisalibacter tunisiensis TaxID=390637 RepID=A0ABS7WVF7_9GAMM|nr:MULTISPECIES: CysB family HTH-type transcriptional regulator [Modicisalibacter]MBZ9540353.1 CysB family HTH-type transcriptional regulator [Modicisalibacter tunisiensis]MBZ9566213.1 CysB family HTH-type transcriptional regulator [Modicisalibacter tunisiensis]
MNLQQLRIVRETVRQSFNLTEAANALFTSQSGASKHIRDLEDELGVELFERRGKRILGLSLAGKSLVDTIERILLDVENLKRSAYQLAHQDQGSLAIATTHTQARYALPPVIARFKEAFPKVHLELHQCSPGEIVSLLKAGKVDLGIATEALHQEGQQFVCFPFYHWYHGVIVPETHPLTREVKLTLERIADYPIVTYHEGFTGRARIDQAFAEANVSPDVVLTALDADVIKTYVELDMGVGLIASVAFHAQRDHGLKLIDASHLFPCNTTYIALRRGHFLRSFAYQFLQLCHNDLDPETVQRALSPALGG